ncbi:MAG: archaemetzincin family Zn-dependent metalloprotease [Smithellaceae bacterium]|nr:archaemetzincin family Zn-dependent metalloprotease [Smithellaceae bacterium]
MAFIYIVSIKSADPFWRKPLEAGIQKTFGIETRFVTDWRIDLPKTYDSARGQYNSSGILLQLIEAPPADAVKILGVAQADLFIPILTFVFGEAQLDGIGSVVSLHRLNNKYYGLPENQMLQTERLVKEAIHELGHTFGLVHCTYPACVLNKSTYVEDIDQKSQEFCKECRQDLEIMLKGLRFGKTIR